VSDVSACGCGSDLPLISKVEGRDRDIIVDSYGVPRPGYLFVEVISELCLEGKFQVVQDSTSNLTIRVESGHSVSDQQLSTLQQRFQHIIGPKLCVQILEVPKIERDPSGKFSYVKSNLSAAQRSHRYSAMPDDQEQLDG
jgi:phenylacetate-coenzyme A ligase PaaK-like adenylate-forming protein